MQELKELAIEESVDYESKDMMVPQKKSPAQLVDKQKMTESALTEALPRLQHAEEKPQSPLPISDVKSQLDVDPSSAKGEAEQPGKVESPSLDFAEMPAQSQKNRVDSNKPS
jgi:hypothetical protein